MRLAILASLLAGALALQSPFESKPISALGEIPTGDYAILKSKSHPKHHVRIQSHQGWCDPNVRSYTGYLDTGDGDNLFFYFFESRSKPKEDPLVMWINGGPGGSSAMGLFQEQGPCRINKNPKTINDTYVNEYAWNENANIFFLDQPIGVGFSHAEHGNVVSTTEEAAKDVSAFIEIFIDTFEEFKGRPFHMTGESYGGRYLPVFASAVFDNNAKMKAAGKEPVNLKSVAIGNGGTSLFKLVESIYPMLCSEVPELGKTILPITTCVSMAEAIPRCKRMMQKHCLDTSDYTSCSMWFSHCEVIWGDAPLLGGVSRYNVAQSCSPEQMAENLCMEESKYVKDYLNLPDVREFLGIDKHTCQGCWDTISFPVNHAFESHLDFTHQTYYYVANLLERGVKVINYVGTLDAACDHFGQSLWMDEMDWSGHQGYLAAPTEEWKVDGKVAGSRKAYKNLELIKIFGAGHLVPTDKPKEALVLLNDYIIN